MMPIFQNVTAGVRFVKLFFAVTFLSAFVSQQVFVFADGAAVDSLKTQRPNIVLVYADDVDCEMVFGQFPQQDVAGMRFRNLQTLATEGVRFSNFHVTTPVCGPSRACLYSGQYAHRNGCRVNDPASIRAQGFDGGFKTFDPQNELASWMKDAGYATAHVGKYLHSDYKPDKSRGLSWKSLVPPGWDHFRLSLGGKYFQFPVYVKATNTFQQSVGTEYRTDWDIRNAVDVLHCHVRSEDQDRPLFLCWSPIAAHVARKGQSMAAPRHEAMFSDAEIPDVELRFEAKVRGQVSEMSSLPIPSQQRQERLTEVYRDRLRAMKSIDEGVGTIRTELKNLGMAENTIFIFTSDHGFRFAQHRHYGKRLPYDRISRVPFIAVGPGIPDNTQTDELLCNIDIAPTLVRLAGRKSPSSCDGISFSNLLFDPVGAAVDREAIAIENWGEAVSFKNVIAATYASLRYQNAVYTEWASGGREYYDLSADPEQLHNRFDELTQEQQAQFSSRLKGLRQSSNQAPIIGETCCEELSQHSRGCASLSPVEFSGLVDADAGVGKVEIEFRCVDSGEYWNGSNWVAVPCPLAADLAQPEGLNSEWSYGLDTSHFANAVVSLVDPRQVQLSVVVTDLLGRQTRQKSLAFELSILPLKQIELRPRTVDGLLEKSLSGE